MNTKKTYYYLTPFMMAILIFSSNFLDTELFHFGGLNFAVWFVLSLFCFSCGWLMDKTLGWKSGGKALFALTVAASLLSVGVISFFSDYFGSSQLLAENLILYSLRNVTLGCMGFFGMTLAELMIVQSDIRSQNFKIDAYEKIIENAHREAEMEVKEAKLKAGQIIADAEAKAKKMLENKERIEKDLKEFIQTEKELLKRYED